MAPSAPHDPTPDDLKKYHELMKNEFRSMIAALGKPIPAYLDLPTIESPTPQPPMAYLPVAQRAAIARYPELFGLPDPLWYLADPERLEAARMRHAKQLAQIKDDLKVSISDYGIANLHAVVDFLNAQEAAAPAAKVVKRRQALESLRRLPNDAPIPIRHAAIIFEVAERTIRNWIEDGLLVRAAGTGRVKRLMAEKGIA